MIDKLVIFFIWVGFSAMMFYIYREGKNTFNGVKMVLYSLISFLCFIWYSSLALDMLINGNV